MSSTVATDLSIVMACYGQPHMLAVWWKTLLAYEPEVQARLELVVVDDAGSPPAEIPPEVQESLVTTQLWRMDENIPWNQPGGRNHGMRQASSPVCVMVDPDMVINERMIHRFMMAAKTLPRGHVMKFGLHFLQGTRRGRVDTTSPNTYLIHKEDFFDAGGYDEDFAGAKGWSDVQLLDILNEHYRLITTPKMTADYYETSMVPDAMVTTLDRSITRNRALRLRKAKEAAEAGGWRAWVKRVKGPNFRVSMTKVL